MTAIARLEVIPVERERMSEPIARAIDALEEYDVEYVTTATDTIIQADGADELFEAARAAHEAVDEDRVITTLEIDDQRTRDQAMGDRVASVEQALGHAPEQREEA